MDEDLRLIEVPSDGILKLEYNGGGDSGFVEIDRIKAFFNFDKSGLSQDGIIMKKIL